MERVSKNIQGDFARKSSSINHISNTTLNDLNYDCLREIFQHLDLATQFSVIKSSKKFLNIILYDIWYPFYTGVFDINKDQSMELQTIDFQTDFLVLVLKNFTSIKGISLEIFQRCLKKSSIKEFSQIISLSLHNHYKTKTENKSLDMREFYKFPLLQELQLKNILVDFQHRNNFLHLKSLNLKNIVALNDLEGEFLKNLFSKNMEKFTFHSLLNINIFSNNFIEISKCVQLKELTLSCQYLYDTRVLDCILNLPGLHLLTLTSKDMFYFCSKDHTIFYAILKIFSAKPFKVITGLQINGIPEKTFYMCPYLQDVISLNWIVRKIFHRKLDGSVEWKSDIPQVIKSFYDFVINNNQLEYVFVQNNIFHKQRMLKEVEFEEKLHECRRVKGLKRLNIVNNYNKQIRESISLNNLAEGSVSFFIKNK